MGGTRYTKREPQYDSEYLKKMNNLSGGNFATSTPTTVSKPGQYVKTRGGIFNGAFGSIASQSLAISSGILNIDQDLVGESIVVRRVVFIAPNSGVADTLDHIDMLEKELPYQELILLGTAGNTITISHDNAGFSTSQREILCPGDTDYILTGDEAVYLIYNTVLNKWIITSSTASAAGISNIVEDTTPQLGGNLECNGFDIHMNIGEELYFDGGSDTYLTGSATSGKIQVYNNGVNVSSFLTSGFSTTNITCSGLGTTGDIDLNSNDIIDIKTIVFNNSGRPTSGQVGIGSLTGDMYLEVPTPDSYFFRVSGTTVLEVDEDGIDVRGGYIELSEGTPPAGATNDVRIYAVINGSSKTELRAVFQSGSSQIIASEP